MHGVASVFHWLWGGGCEGKEVVRGLLTALVLLWTIVYQSQGLMPYIHFYSLPIYS